MELWWQGSSLHSATGTIAQVHNEQLVWEATTYPLNIQRFPRFGLQCSLGTCQSGFSTTQLRMQCGDRYYIARKQGSTRLIYQGASFEQAARQPATFSIDLRACRATIPASQPELLADHIFILTASYLVDMAYELRI